MRADIGSAEMQTRASGTPEVRTSEAEASVMVRMPETPGIMASETPEGEVPERQVRVPETPEVRASETPGVRAPETPGIRVPETQREKHQRRR